MPYPSPASLILVCYLPSPRDLEIARLLGWYRIPLRSAPKVVAVDWLAFYQPGSFGGQKWRIQSVAPLRGHELVTRAELFKDQLDHPRAREEYFKLQLGPLVELPAPILAGGWKRLTFLYTTGEYLLAARTVRDLVVQQEERKLLWSALRERASQEQAYRSRPELPEVEVDPTVLALLLGIPETGDLLTPGEN